MRKAIVITALLALLLPATVVAQDETPTVTVVPNDQFCSLVSDDLTACEQALTTLASAGMLPEAFAGLTSASSGAADDASAAAGEAVAIEGAGDVNTAPFMLVDGDYQVTIDAPGDCEFITWRLRQTDGERLVQAFQQSGYAYSVEGGRHFLDVSDFGDCASWSFTIAPLEG